MNKTIYAICALFLFTAGRSVLAQENMPQQVEPQGAPVIVNFTTIAEFERAHPPAKKMHFIEQGEDREKDAKWNKRPLPSGAPAYDVELPQPKANQRITAVSPPPKISFNGSLDNGTSIPPDIRGAAGPTYLLQTTNQLFEIRTKTGTSVGTTSPSGFFSSSGGSGFFDPHVVYDPNYGRYIICIAGDLSNGHSGIFIAVSQTNDPRSNWYIYTYDATGNTSDLLDFPMLGYNTNWIVVTGNNFTTNGTLTKVMIFNRATLYAGSSGTATTYNDNSVFSLCPAQTKDITQTNLYLIAENIGSYNGYGYMQVCRITGAVNSPSYGYVNSLGVNKPWSDNAIGGLQKGSANTIDAGDTRVGGDATYVNGSMWFSHNVFLPASSPTHIAVDWWQIDPSAMTVQQFGRVEDATAAIDYYYPAIAVNSIGDALLGYCMSGTNYYPSVGYSFHANTDGAGVMEDTYIAKAGLASYYKTLGGGRNRYGDYTGSAVDPSDNSFWNFCEWANTGNYWGTYITNVASSTNSPCLVASGLVTSGITDKTATFSWSPIATAISYNVRYRQVGTSTWTTVSTASTTYNVSGLTGNTNYEWQVQTVCTGGSSAYSSSATFLTLVTCNVSTPVANGTTICYGKTASLEATGADSLYWYAVPSGGTIVGKGSSFTSPALTANTSYYVESNVFPASQKGGPASNAIGAGGYFTLTNIYHDLIFDALAPFKLVSVLVYSGAAGDRTITLINSSGVTLSQKTVNIPAGASRVTLNFDVPAGTNLELGMIGNVNLYRNSDGAVFPYTVPNILSIKGTNAVGSPGYYYYFYDWQIIGPACKSQRCTVNVAVNNPVADFSSSVNAGSVTFTDQSAGVTSWSWKFGDGGTSSQQSPTHVYTSTGTYTVTLIGCSGSCCDTIIKTVQVLTVGINEPAAGLPITVYPNPFRSTVQLTFGNAILQQGCTLKVINAIGESVKELTLSPSEIRQGYTISTAEFAKGVYTLIVQSEGRKYSQRIIKE